jgi:hypothetical protein
MRGATRLRVASAVQAPMRQRAEKSLFAPAHTKKSKRCKSADEMRAFAPSYLMVSRRKRAHRPSLARDFACIAMSARPDSPYEKNFAPDALGGR